MALPFKTAIFFEFGGQLGIVSDIAAVVLAAGIAHFRERP
jgi:hypothetical protein